MAAWPGLKTWVRGVMVTASDLNTYITQAMDHLKGNQAALGGLFSGLSLGTHPDNDKANTQVRLRKLDNVILDNGVGLSNVGVLTADITLSGIGGLDAGAEESSEWYEIWLAHNGSTGAKGLLLHKSKKYSLDQTYDSDDATVEVRKSTGTRTALGQGFKVGVTGLVEFIDVELIRVGSTTGNIWAELRSDDGTGKPSATVLAKSQMLYPGYISTTAHWIRFLFDTPVSLTATTQYHLVITGDWTASDAVYIGWRCDTSSASYADGTRTQEEGAAWNSTGTTAHDFSFKIYVTVNDAAVTMPSGYDGKALLGFVRNTAAGNFRWFQAVNRKVIPVATWEILNGATAAVPTLYHSQMLDAIPPRPVHLQVATDNDSAGSVYVGPVPGGFSTGIAFRVGGQTLSFGGFVTLSILTETQALYAYDTSGTFDLLVDSWEW